MKSLLIGGSQRSGTTLLNKFVCLDSHTNPKIAEASYLRDLLVAYQQALNDFDHDTADYFDNVQDLRQFHSSLVNLFINRSTKRFGDISTLVLKEPHLTRFFPALYDLLPHVQFLVSVRDPRDIIASMLEVGERMRAAGQEHFFQQRNIQQLCQHVLAFYAPVFNNTHEGFRKQCLWVKYEELVLNTEKVRQDIARFSGLAMDFPVDSNPNDSMLKLRGEGDPEHRGQKRYEPWITTNNSKAINASSIGHYREVLSQPEIEVLEQEMRDFMRVFAYE